MSDCSEDGAASEGRLFVPQAPCSTCPYRRDTPSGVWAAHEYEKLPDYDDDRQESMAVFLCHQTNATGRETVCRGWLTVASESVAVRLARLRGSVTEDEVYAPPSVPLYATGAEACTAGLRDIEDPSDDAATAQRKLLRRRAASLEWTNR